jgi:hypothetical protein
MPGVRYAGVIRIGRELPGVEEGTSYGTPALKVRGKLLARLREDGDLVIRVEPEVRAILLDARPEAFFITDHYRDYPAVLVRLSKVRHYELRELLEAAWRRYAPKRLVASRDEPAKSR